MSDFPHEIVARREFNDQQPISRLPLEILLIVFRSTDAYEERGENYEWTKVLLVCHRWYTVGTGSAILWDTLTHLGGLECMRTMLDRSQGLLLNVSTLFISETSLVDKDDRAYTTADRQKITCYNQVSHALLQEMPRIQTLEVTANEDFWKTIATNELPCKLTKLTLDLIRNEDRPDRVFNASSDWLFSAALPDLRELWLNLGIHARGIIRASGLRTLHIDNKGYYASSYTPRDLLESLRHMPLLEEVSLVHAFPCATAEEEGPDVQLDGDIVHLPKIDFFEFYDGGDTFSQFLRCVAFPATAEIILGCDVYSPIGVHDAVASFREKLTAKLLGEEQTEHYIQSLSVQTCNGGYDGSTRSLRFEGCPHRDHDSSFCEQWCESPTLVFVLSYAQTDFHKWDRLDGFAEILELMPLDYVEVFDIQSVDAYNTFKVYLGLLNPDKVVGTAPPEEDSEDFRGPLFDKLMDRLLKLMPSLDTIQLNFDSRAGALGDPASDDDSE